MSKHHPRFQIPSIHRLPTRHASLEELRRRAAPLRTAIAHERDLARVVHRFFDAFSEEERLFETSVRSDEPRLHAVLAPLCPAGAVISLRTLRAQAFTLAAEQLDVFEVDFVSLEKELNHA